MMTEDDIVERGIRSQELLLNATMAYVVDELIKEINNTFLMSAPEDEGVRQRAYYAYQGVKDIVGLLNQWVAAKDHIIAARDAANDDIEGN